MIVAANDAVDATTIVAGIQVDELLDLLRQTPWMFDYFAVHVGEVEISVGTILELDGAKPIITRGDEFTRFLIVGPGRRSHFRAHDEFFCGE